MTGYTLFSSEDVVESEEDLRENTKTDNSLLNYFSLHKEAFFGYSPCASEEDWNNFVECDRKLSRVKRVLLNKL
jgi:hypothetical protein